MCVGESQAYSLLAKNSAASLHHYLEHITALIGTDSGDSKYPIAVSLSLPPSVRLA